MNKVLEKFDFGNNFISSYNTFYKNLSAKLLINGHIGPSFPVNRGVKQGDALSCVTFILCMEVLIKLLESNPNIKSVNLRNPQTLIDSNKKVFSYADDITIVVNDKTSI